MNDEHEKEDEQAKELKRLFNEVQNGESKAEKTDEVRPVRETGEVREIDILNLPPRKEVHSNTKHRTTFKINGALLRLIIVILLLILVIAGMYYMWGNDVLEIFNHYEATIKGAKP
ncbi:hypothetical protein [Virgibacillus siamensis]|uniref:hypothetical protein n=1 Tax=Virgibacillus siamensis TaxID=480071 RepID=UPI0009879960|nr:hypothetical protein [Virgibacillus siamensis]